MNERVRIGHNGGPPLDDPAAPAVYIGEKFLPLFEAYRHKAYYGGRGSAKSHTFADALTIITSKMEKRVVCARQFQNSIKESVKELLEAKMRNLRLVGKKGFWIGEREIVHEGTGSRYIFIGLDRNPASAKSLEGADICWVEEARTISKHSMEILIPTIRKPGSELWWSWNPELRNDPVDLYFRGPQAAELAAKFEDVSGMRRIVRQVYIEDNPYFYHTPLAHEMLFMKAGNLARYRHIWLGEYDDAYDTKIFTNVEIGRVRIPDYCAPRYGMDFGFGQDPCAIVKVYIIEEYKVVYVAREGGGHIPLKDLPAAIESVVEDRGDYIKADSGQPQTIQYCNTNGFNVDGAKKGPGSIKAGITWLQGYKIVIDPDCEELREEARLYTWQVDKITRKKLNVPVDAHNHYWDAVRYACEDHILTANVENPQDDGVLSLKF